MTLGRLPSGSVSLREAAVRIFALVALLPFLLLVFVLVLLLQRPDLVTPLQLQVSLLLAFLTTFVGFVAFYRMVAQIARIADATGAATTGDGAPATAAVQPPTVPGLGQIAEIGQMGTTLSRMLEDLRTSAVRLEDQLLKSSTLNELVELAAKVPRIQNLLALVLERTMRAVSAAIGSIMLLDREHQLLRVAAARGLPERARAGAEVRVGEGIAGTVAAGDAQRMPVPPRRVLLIDDQPEVRAGLADLLRADGHGVLEAGDGPEALARLEAGEEVDVVLTDLGMPGMTGRDVARAIRARWPGLRVGLVTGWTDEVETASAEHTPCWTSCSPSPSTARRCAWPWRRCPGAPRPPGSSAEPSRSSDGIRSLGGGGGLVLEWLGARRVPVRA